MALGKQASQGNGTKETKERFRQFQQHERLSRQEISLLKRELETERERCKQLPTGIARYPNASKEQEYARLSTELEQASAARQQAEKKLRRLSEQLVTTRVELQKANQQRIAANEARQRAEAALEQSRTSHVALEQRFAVAGKAASKRDQADVVRALKGKLSAVLREREASLQERSDTIDELAAEQSERRALEKRLGKFERKETSSGRRTLWPAFATHWLKSMSTAMSWKRISETTASGSTNRDASCARCAGLPPAQRKTWKGFGSATIVRCLQHIRTTGHGVSFGARVDRGEMTDVDGHCDGRLRDSQDTARQPVSSG